MEKENITKREKLQLKKAHRPKTCFYCKQTDCFHIHGEYYKSQIDIRDGSFRRVLVCRYKCKGCGKTEIVIPNNESVKYKRYSGSSISHVLYLVYGCDISLNMISQYYKLSINLFKSWLDWYSNLSKGLLSELRKKFGSFANKSEKRAGHESKSISEESLETIEMVEEHIESLNFSLCDYG